MRWSDEELADLATIRPGVRGDVAKFALHYKRDAGAVSSKLAQLRRRGLADDVDHKRAPLRLHRRFRFA